MKIIIILDINKIFMNYYELRRGTLKVLFLIWCVISLASVIK